MKVISWSHSNDDADVHKIFNGHLLRSHLSGDVLEAVMLVVLQILDILAQCNRPKPNPACTSSLGFSRLYILMLWLIVTQVIVLHSYT